MIGRALRELFGSRGGAVDDEFYERLEDALIEADVGPGTAARLVRTVKETVDRRAGEGQVRDALADAVLAGLRTARLPEPGSGLTIILVLGVNGVGKTTTVAKLAAYLQAAGRTRLMLAAADTFRAAAIDQLKIWGERLKVPVVHQQPGADPGAVVYDAITSAKARGTEVLLVDTAGRMHTKEHLVRELAKIGKIIEGRLENAQRHNLLVLDATTGQNALSQAEAFREAVAIDSVCLAKFDSTAKGGVALPLCLQHQQAISFVGVGESLGNLEAFDPRAFVTKLLGP